MAASTFFRVHRASAAVLVLFGAVHIFNHLLAIHSMEAHTWLLHLLRHAYRWPPVETLLLVCVAMQSVSGVRLLLARPAGGGWRRRLQRASGAYLAFFLLVHVAAVLAGRGLFGLDTDLRYAAAGLHVAPFAWFFAPYYWLAVAAFALHLGCALRRVPTLSLLGVLAASLIVAAMMGAFHRVEIPAEYRATYASSDANAR